MAWRCHLCGKIFLGIHQRAAHMVNLWKDDSDHTRCDYAEYHRDYAVVQEREGVMTTKRQRVLEQNALDDALIARYDGSHTHNNNIYFQNCDTFMHIGCATGGGNTLPPQRATRGSSQHPSVL